MEQNFDNHDSQETFEKYSILFKFKEGDPAMAGLTTEPAPCLTREPLEYFRIYPPRAMADENSSLTLWNMLRIPQGRRRN